MLTVGLLATLGEVKFFFLLYTKVGKDQERHLPLDSPVASPHKTNQLQGA